MTCLQMMAPLSIGLLVWIPFSTFLRRGHRGRAALVVAAWAAAMMIALPALEHARPGSCGLLVPGAARYGAEMLDWARTGIGCESQPACFVPQHLLHVGAFAAASIATAGALGLGFAAVLFGWMGAYAGALGVASDQPLLAAALAWHPWALVRVAAYVVLGVALAEPLSRRGLPPLPGRRRWWVAGLVGLLLDLALKTVLAPLWWRVVIHPMVVH